MDAIHNIVKKHLKLTLAWSGVLHMPESFIPLQCGVSLVCLKQNFVSKDSSTLQTNSAQAASKDFSCVHGLCESCSFHKQGDGYFWLQLTHSSFYVTPELYTTSTTEIFVSFLCAFSVLPQI